MIAYSDTIRCSSKDQGCVDTSWICGSSSNRSGVNTRDADGRTIRIEDGITHFDIMSNTSGTVMSFMMEGINGNSFGVGGSKTSGGHSDVS